MTTPAEPIPVAQAIPMSARSSTSTSSPPAATTGTPSSGPTTTATPTTSASTTNVSIIDFFQSLSLAQLLRRTIAIYLGHFDTFLTITVVVTLPVLVGYHWMRQGYWGSSHLFHYLLLPLSRVVADGAAVFATAFIYLQQGQPISWKLPLQKAWQTLLFSCWLLQILRASLLGRWILVPTGSMAFTTPLLLLKAKSSLLGSFVTSSRLVYFHSIGTLLTTIVVTYGVTPFLSWILRRLVGDFVVGSGMTTVKDDADENEMDDGSLDFFSQRRQVQEVIALPLISCLWTILYLNICIQKRRGAMTRESLAAEMGVSLPPSMDASIY